MEFPPDFSLWNIANQYQNELIPWIFQNQKIYRDIKSLQRLDKGTKQNCKMGFQRVFIIDKTIYALSIKYCASLVKIC